MDHVIPLGLYIKVRALRVLRSETLIVFIFVLTDFRSTANFADEPTICDYLVGLSTATFIT